MEIFVDLYTDYLITSSSYTTATGMASLLSIKHDKITRELSKGVYDSKFLWKTAKPYIQELTQSKETIVLSFDDSIEEKRYTAQSTFHFKSNLYFIKFEKYESSSWRFKKNLHAKECRQGPRSGR